MKKYIDFWSTSEAWISNSEHSGALITILFGFTSGVIALVGLIAIFVSLNSQQNLQKCRELYWNMSSMSIRDDFTDFYETFSLYKSIFEEGPKEKFTKQIITTARLSILAVICVWGITSVYVINQFFIGEYIVLILAYLICIYILFRFSLYLDKLKNIMKRK